MDGKWMLVEPAPLSVERVDDENKSWKGTLFVTLREA
jgi:hypothetical protein